MQTVAAIRPTHLPTITSPGHARQVPTVFALAHVNPLNGKPYRESPYMDLPPYVLAVIGLTASVWDLLVRRGVLSLVLDTLLLHDVAPVLGELRERQRLIWDGELSLADEVGVRLCEECLGTLVAHDFDGSITGTVEAPYVCDCWTVERAGAPHPHLGAACDSALAA